MGTTTRNMKFGDRAIGGMGGGGGIQANNLLGATVYATINYRQSKEHGNGR